MFVSMLKESMPPGSKGHTYCSGIRVRVRVRVRARVKVRVRVRVEARVRLRVRVTAALLQGHTYCCGRSRVLGLA